jgi:hypothetical protein
VGIHKDRSMFHSAHIADIAHKWTRLALIKKTIRRAESFESYLIFFGLPDTSVNDPGIHCTQLVLEALDDPAVNKRV